MLEIGVPAADPRLDGPTVRDSMARALAAGVSPARASAEIASLRERFPEQAMVWMSYPEAVDDGWRGSVLASGVDGVLLPERADAHPALAAELQAAGIALAQFVPFPPSGADLEAARAARGYVMVQARPGPTGPGGPSERLAEQLGKLREAGVGAPLAVGFGIRDAATALRVVELGADAVIVGSAIVEAALIGAGELRRLVGSLRGALDG